jgi:hypothetical protein
VPASLPAGVHENWPAELISEFEIVLPLNESISVYEGFVSPLLTVPNDIRSPTLALVPERDEILRAIEGLEERIEEVTAGVMVVAVTVDPDEVTTIVC